MPSVTDYLLSVLYSTANQLFVLTGPILILGLLMNLVSVKLSRMGTRIFGNSFFTYAFKSIGTPIHELGHALFALLFAHAITGVKLFDPAGKEGSLGSVSHSYKRGNIYQETGNFFIGIGPILMCTIVLYLSIFLLFRLSITSIASVSISMENFSNLASVHSMTTDLFHGLQTFTSAILAGVNTNWWKISLFIYLQIAIGSSITLSGSDLKSAFKGFLFIILLVLIFNLTTRWIGDFAITGIYSAGKWLSGFYFIMIIALVINSFLLIVFFLLGMMINLVNGGKSTK